MEWYGGPCAKNHGENRIANNTTVVLIWQFMYKHNKTCGYTFHTCASWHKNIRFHLVTFYLARHACGHARTERKERLRRRTRWYHARKNRETAEEGVTRAACKRCQQTMMFIRLVTPCQLLHHEQEDGLMCDTIVAQIMHTHDTAIPHTT